MESGRGLFYGYTITFLIRDEEFFCCCEKQYRFRLGSVKCVVYATDGANQFCIPDFVVEDQHEDSELV